MKIAILGFARDGQAAFDFFAAQGGHKITVCDQDKTKQIPDGAHAKLGKDYLKDLAQFDLVVRTAGLHPRLIQQANPEASDILDKVTGNVDLFYQYSPSKNIIGVTGTKGKGTTSTLITEMLQKSGKTVYLGGNIGIPALELLKKPIQAEDWIVLEQSSFQLIDQKHSPKIGVCLMVVPEHLDWHADFDEYIDAKSQLFIHQTPDDTAIYFAENDASEDIASASEGHLLPYFTAPGAEIKDGEVVIDNVSICKTDEIKLLGKHNWQNVCAALTTVWQIVQDREAAREVITIFSGLPNRLELVREVEGIQFFNDSFASTPHAPLAAIDAIDGELVVILGGYDRNLDLADLAKGLKTRKNRLAQVVLIGAARQRLASELQKVNFTKYSVHDEQTMKSVVQAAQSAAKTQSAQAVILTPGFASFDMFKDFEDRGNQFRECVQNL